MPKLNYDKLPYKKFRQSISVPSEDSHGFYSPIPGPTPEYYRGYHTYDYFGPTIRRHEKEEEKDDKDNEDNERWPTFII